MPNDRRQDHYDVLGVSPAAPEEVIRAAYRALAAKYHPDRNPGDRDAELKLKRVNAAFRVLGNPERKEQYDELTRGPEAIDESPPEPPRADPPRWKVPEEPRRQDPRWKVPGEEHRAHTVDTPSSAKQKPTDTSVRVLLACAAAGLSLYINLSHDGFQQNESALMGW